MYKFTSPCFKAPWNCRPGRSSLDAVRPQGGALVGVAVDGLKTSNDIKTKHTYIPYSGKPTRVKSFANFAVSRQFVIVLTAKIFIEYICRRHYQWGCYCRFPQFAKALIARIRLSAIRESFHPRKIPVIYTVCNYPV